MNRVAREPQRLDAAEAPAALLSKENKADPTDFAPAQPAPDLTTAPVKALSGLPGAGAVDLDQAAPKPPAPQPVAHSSEIPADGPQPRKTRENEPEETAENTSRYQCPEAKSGTDRRLRTRVGARLLAVTLGTAAVIAYMKNTEPPEAIKTEAQNEDPSAPADPNSADQALEPEGTRPALELTAARPAFTVGKEPIVFERADKPSEPRFILETEFDLVRRAFPPFDPKTADTFVVVRTGTNFALDAYSPSSRVRVSRLEFTADPVEPIWDLHSSATATRFLAASGGKLTVWDLEGNTKLADAVDPFAGKPDHQKDGLAAAFFAPQPDQIVTVSTAGAVHLFDVRRGATVSEFIAPRGARGKVILGASVARAAGGGSIVLVVGGVLYQIKAGAALDRLRVHDLGGEVKPLAVAASGTPGRLLLTLETKGKGKKDRALFYLPLGAESRPVTSLWPPGAGAPKGALWVNDTSAGVITESGVVWFSDDQNKFGPVVVTRPAGGGLYFGAGNLFWFVVPHPSNPARSVLVPQAVPFGDTFEFRGAAEANEPLRVLRIDPNGLAK
ncbi:hypothetical protein J8F10_07960 [Gemmata sp. G18]|uniref:WD40 repeat domain-containing protein n=1 Tax=Gemmata palustris TaxID=2822762 RepID=A0ABS5BNA9_9BACT|nr:hypothetical protein [Gemmata palustris]MBP3955214.1 hypothetical protein [Gemmata palustris]